MPNRPVRLEEELEWRSDRCPVSKRFDDIYFDFEKGLEESRYVFLESNSLYERFDAEKDCLNIGELGFGTGLNFFATAIEFLKRNNRARLLYTSCEKYPLPPSEIQKLFRAWPEIRNIGEEFLLHYFRKPQGFLPIEMANGRIRLQIYFGDVVDSLQALEGHIDAWYFDGFSPKKNPEMWRPEIFKEVGRLSHQETSFSSFSSAGFVRRSLLEQGAVVEKKKGFGWKREMICGSFENRSPLSFSRSKEKIAVVGSGIVASQVCLSLEGRKIDYEVFEANSETASGASGNPLAMTMPFLATKNFDRQMFSTSAYSFQRSRYIHSSHFFESSCRHHFYPEKAAQNLKYSLQNLKWPAEFLVEADNFIQILRAGVIESKKYLDQFWEERESYIHIDSKISEIDSVGSLHWIEDNQMRRYGPYSLVIFCNAGGSYKFFPELAPLLRRNRGQMMFVKNAPFYSSSEVYDKYLSPKINGLQVFGGSYRHDDLDIQITEEESLELAGSFAKIFKIQPEFYGSRAGERFFFRSSWPRLIHRPEEGKAAVIGLGSRGFSESGLCAETLISKHLNELLPVSRREAQFLGLDFSTSKETSKSESDFLDLEI